MSVWNAFKKKIEKTTSGLDWWDEEENRRQQQAIDRKYAQPQQSAPQGSMPNSGMRTMEYRPTPNQGNNMRTLENDMGTNPNTPQNQMRTLEFSFDKPQPLQYDLKPVDQGLTAGKSWEQISKESGVPLDQVRAYSQKTRPTYGIAPKPAQPVQEFTSLQRGEEKNKTIFGHNAAWLLPNGQSNPVSRFLGDLEKTHTVTATGTEKATADQFLTGYDRLGEETRQFWLASLDDKAKKGDAMAQNTLKMLRENGRLEGSAGDFIAGNADKVRGGMARSTLRTVDFVLPGKNTFGLERLADQLEGPRQVTDAGRAGETVGTIEKGIIEARNLIKAGQVADKWAEGTKVVQALDKAAETSKILKPVAFVAKTIPGSLAGTAVDIQQEKGRGNDVNYARSIGVGTAADLIAPSVFKGLGKVIKGADNLIGNVPSKAVGSLVGAGKNKIAKLLGNKVDDIASEVTGKPTILDDHIASRTRQVNGITNKQLDIVEQTKQLTEQNSQLLPTDPKYAENSLAIKKNLRDLDELNATKAGVDEEITNLQQPSIGNPQGIPKPLEAPVQKTIPELLAESKASSEAPTPPASTTVNNVVPPTESKLGTIAQDFFDSRKGNQAIKFADLEQLGNKVAQQIDSDFKAIGSDFPTVARKIEEGLRGGAKNLDEIGITTDEAMLWKKVREEQNYIRRRASTGKREIGEGDFGDLYFPNQRKDGRPESLIEGWRKSKPGNEMTRKNKIDLEDLDYSPDVIGQYITRYGDTKLYQEQRIFNALKKDNPGIDDAQLTKAAAKVNEVQNNANKLETIVTGGGLGKRKTVVDGKYLDTAKEMSDVGEMVGKDQIKIIGKARGLTNGDKINSIMVGDKTLGDFLGLNQWRDAKNYGLKQVFDAKGDRIALARAVEQRLINDFNLNDDAIEYAVRGIGNMAQGLPDQVVNGRIISTYENAAQQQLLENLQKLKIEDPKTRKVVSDITNQILRQGSIENATSAKAVSAILKTQNAFYRKVNLGSALNELGDLPSFLSSFKGHATVIPDFKGIKEFGLGEIDAAIEPYIKQVEAGTPLKSILSQINDKTNLYRFVEHYKAGVVINSAKSKWISEGLSGDALTKAVLDDYRKLALPVDVFTKTVLDDYPLYTQYMSWGARNLEKEGKLLTGNLAAGSLKDMTQKERIIRNAYANLPAKTVFWLSSNALKGTAIMTAFGLTDFTGLTSADFSGIENEDKSWYDRTTQFTNTSTTLSLLNKIVQSVEKENLKNSDKYKDANYNPYEKHSIGGDFKELITPQVAKNVGRTKEMMDRGYSENKSGRVQYEAPTDLWNTAKGYMFGKGQTENAREYSGRQGLIARLEKGDNIIKAIADMAREDLGLQDTDYKRPLTDEYSDAYKAADEGARKALLEGGRQYNKYLDDLKKNNPESYDRYISALDGNHVNPEYWKKIATSDKGAIDLTTFNAIKERKKQQAKDLKTGYDPLYDLNDDQARAVLQQKSTATGDDIALRNSLYKEQWFKDYQKKVADYYKNKAKDTGDSDYKQTQRVVDWYALNDQYNTLRSEATDFPLVAKQKAITEKYGFDSAESKNFFRANSSAYKAQKEQYDAANLDLINKMREIEGYPPMSAEQFKQVNTIADTDGSDDKKKGYGSRSGGSGGSYSAKGDFGQKRALNIPSAKIKVSNVKIKKSSPKTVKIQRNKKA